MDLFIKIIGVVLLALILSAAMSTQGKDFSLLLTIAVCCMVSVCVIGYFRPVLDFFDELEMIGQIDSQMVAVLLKATGIVLLGEITSNICLDAGNAAMAKAILTLTSAVILCLSVPLFTNLVELIEKILITI